MKKEVKVLLTAKEANERGFYFRINGDNCKIMSYKGNEKNVVIPSYINNKPVREIRRGAFRGNKKIEKVELPETIRYIADEAFFNCSELENVSIRKKDDKNEINKTNKEILKVSKKAFEMTKYIDKGKYVVLKDVLIKINDVNKDYHTVIINAKIPEGVRCIANNVFKDGWDIESIYIPKTVSVIKDNAFNCMCYYIKKVVVEKRESLEPLKTGLRAFGYLSLGDKFLECRLKGQNKFLESVLSKYVEDKNREGWVKFLWLNIGGGMAKNVLVYIPCREREEIWEGIYLYAQKEVFNDSHSEMIFKLGLSMSVYYNVFHKMNDKYEKLQMATCMMYNCYYEINYFNIAKEYIKVHINKAIDYAVKENSKEKLMLYESYKLLSDNIAVIKHRHIEYLLKEYKNSASEYLRSVIYKTK